MSMAELTSLTPGMQVIYGGNQVATVSPELADASRQATNWSSCRRPVT